MNFHKVIILGKNDSIYRASFKDLIDSGIKYIAAFPVLSFFEGWLQKIHLSKKINKYINLPYKSYWTKKWFERLPAQKNLIFILFGEWIQIEHHINLIPFLRKKYPNCQIIWFIQDVVKTIKDLYTNKPIDVLQYKKCLDLIVTYDKQDAYKYGLSYHPTVLSKITFDNNNSPEYDVFFVGRYKGRLEELIRFCKKMNQNKVKCGFFIYNVPKEKRIELNGIYYLDNPLAYEENLKLVAKAKCLLELVQTDCVGWTFRTSEALLYQKKLITNNIEIKKAPFYNNVDVFLLDDSFDYQKFAKSIKNNSTPHYSEYEQISPNHFLNFIFDKLNK